jgi:sn-glycerol 3-phosphate transport system substrate-binding protein
MIRRTVSRALVAGAATFSILAGSAHAQERIQLHWWHAMDGGLGEALKEIVSRFNESQDKYEIVETFKGRYRVVLNNTIAAYRAGEHPHLFQNNETGVITLMLSGAIVPVHEILEANEVEVDLDAYLSPVVDTYTHDGKLLGMPFNSSTPIMYYNADLLRQAGFADGPVTWQDMEDMIRAAQDAGVTGADGEAVCGYAYSGGMWDNVENWSSIHDQPYTTGENGRAGLEVELVYNTTKLVDHQERLARWIEEDLAEFGAESPTDWSSAAFTDWGNGNCLFWSGSTASHARVERTAQFDWSAVHFPHDSDIIDEPRNSTIGGAALYTLKGFSEEEYAGLAEFFRMLTSVEIQKYWHQKTGYVPITIESYEQLVEEGYYQKNPTYEIAVKQLLRGKPGPNNRVPRIGNFENVRMALEAELQKVYAGEQDVQTALDNGVRRGNEILRRFEQQNAGKL